MITQKEKKMLLYAAGILSIVLAYVLVVAPGKEKRTELKSEGAVLTAELEQAEQHAKMQEYYEQETATMQTRIDEVLAEFPADIKEETAIMYADMLENKSDIYIPGISIGANNLLYTLGQDSGETANDGVSLYGTQISYSFTVPYADMKQVIRTIQEEEEQRNVESITLSYEAGSGELVGSMLVNMYSVTGTDKPYAAPEVPAMSLGTDNIFGTVESAYIDEKDENVQEDDSADEGTDSEDEE